MKDNRTPNYGLDAPVAVRNMLIVAALGIISLITRLLGVWSRQDVIAVIARPLMVAGLSCGAMALWMIYDSKIGKIRERDTYLDKINWNGHERVLDVGCGLGLFLIGAARRLSTGRAVGIDKWQQEDLSGNHAAGTLGNAMIEGVADKVEVHTGDARKLPFDDASFDVVLSSMALHNISNAGERQTAVREIARVLGSGGRVLIVDVRHTRQYAATLRDAGLDARCVQGIVSYLLTVITFGSIQVGYVIGSKAGPGEPFERPSHRLVGASGSKPVPTENCSGPPHSALTSRFTRPGASDSRAPAVNRSCPRLAAANEDGSPNGTEVRTALGSRPVMGCLSGTRTGFSGRQNVEDGERVPRRGRRRPLALTTGAPQGAPGRRRCPNSRSARSRGGDAESSHRHYWK